MLLLLIDAPPVQHLPSVLSKRGHWAQLASSQRPWEELFVRGGGPWWRVESGGNTSWAGADGGQRLLAAVQEGGVVGSLMGAVVVVRLPTLTLLLPLAAKDPDERLKTQRHKNTNFFFLLWTMKFH